MKQRGTIVIGIYFHPELFPPTLYALLNLCEQYEKVVVVGRHTLRGKFMFPANCEWMPSGPYISVKESESKSILWKLHSFIRFTRDLHRAIKKNRPAWILVYDSFPLLSTRFMHSRAFKNARLWYHSHDVPEMPAGRLSLGKWAVAYQQKAFQKIELFTLPSAERKQFFPLALFKGTCIVLPNYPSLKFHQPAQPRRKPDAVLRLVYQGSLSEGHGFEEIINLLHIPVAGKLLQLTLIGPIREEYKHRLEQLAGEAAVAAQLHILPPVLYSNLATETGKHDIGLAIHKPQGIIYSTGGTASNKIYEYAAKGLPVLYFDNEHYRLHLGKFGWTAATTLEPGNLVGVLEEVNQRYEDMSRSAALDFNEKINYEIQFAPIQEYLSGRSGS
jgi:hypothetical protein